MDKIKTICVGALSALIVCSGVSIAEAAAAGPLKLRLRGIAVVPRDNADITPIGGSTEINTKFVPEIDITYHVTKHFAFELIAATAKHDVEAVRTSIGTVDLGSVRHIPPTLTLQYHFSPDAQVRPYVGAGLNYTIFLSLDDPEGLDVKYDNGFGAALQAGVDIGLNDNWHINFDVKRLFLDTDVSINAEALSLGTIDADVDVDPWIFGIGLGYTFPID